MRLRASMTFAFGLACSAIAVYEGYHVVPTAEGSGDAGRVDLHAADVALRRLILGIDRERQRLDGGQVEV